MHIIYLWCKICARSRSFAYSPSFAFMPHFQSKQPNSKNTHKMTVLYLHTTSYHFIPLHNISYPFVRWNLFERIQWLTSWAVWRVILQRKCYSAEEAARKGWFGSKKSTGFFPLESGPLIGNLAETVVPFQGEFKNTTDPPGPPQLESGLQLSCRLRSYISM